MRLRNWLFIGGAVVLAGGAYVAYQYFQRPARGNGLFQTAVVTSGSIATSVSASGTIAAPEASTLSWATTGTIQKIDVAVGQTVKAGDVLAELDSASLSADVIQGQADLLAAQKNLATVQAGPTADQIAAARLAVVQAEQVVTQTQRTLNADTTPNVAYYQDQFNRAQEAVSAAQSTVSNDQYQIALRTASDALANAKSNLEQWQILEQRYPGYSAMHGDGLANAQTKYDRAVQDFNVAQANVQNSSTNDANALADAQSKLTTATANLKAAQAGPNAATVQLDTARLEQAKAAVTAAQKTLDDLLKQPDAAAIAEAQAAVAKAADVANRKQLVAPFSGTVLGIYNRPGDVVNSGTQAIVIADVSSLKIQVSVSEVDVNQIQPGQAVSITVDAAPGSTYSGVVDQLVTLGTSTQGVVTFPVLVTIPNPDPALKPGMSAAVAIQVAQHDGVLLVPNKAIRVSNGERTVTVIGNGQRQQVPVTIGLTNDTVSEVTSGGLKAGDRVVVVTSTTTSGSTGGNFGGGFLFGGGGRNGGGPPAGP